MITQSNKSISPIFNSLYIIFSLLTYKTQASVLLQEQELVVNITSHQVTKFILVYKVYSILSSLLVSQLCTRALITSEGQNKKNADWQGFSCDVAITIKIVSSMEITIIHEYKNMNRKFIKYNKWCKRTSKEL